MNPLVFRTSILPAVDPARPMNDTTGRRRVHPAGPVSASRAPRTACRQWEPRESTTARKGARNLAQTKRNGPDGTREQQTSERGTSMCFRPPSVDQGPVKCPKCGAMVDPSLDACPKCGAKAEASTSAPPTPGAPGAPKVPSVPKVPATPGAPKVPSVPKVPSAQQIKVPRG